LKHIVVRIDLTDLLVVVVVVVVAVVVVVVDTAYSMIQYMSTIKQLKQMGKLTRRHN